MCNFSAIMPKEPISLYVLCEGIKKYIARRLKNNLIWVTAEISQINKSGMHYYVDLVENDGKKEKAKMRAVIWNSDYRRFRPSIKGVEENILKVGSKVLLQVEVEFHVQFGLNLIIRDVDASYTLGELERKRKETLQKLQDLNLLDLNKQQKMPVVVQRIALIASPKTSGYSDFVNHLHNNIYGYQFQHNLFPTSVQGMYAEAGIITQLRHINRRKSEFDVVVLIRGGGAKLDLEVFNGFDMAKQIAELELPVITGIGHETDLSIVDMVAHTYQKTPTAVADFIIERAAIFESEIIAHAQKVTRLSLQLLENSKLRLSRFSAHLNGLIQERLYQKKSNLQYIQAQLLLLSNQKVSKHQQHLAILEKALHLLNPENILKRGYSLTLHKGKIVTAQTKLKKGDVLVTKVTGLSVESEVKKVKKEDLK